MAKWTGQDGSRKMELGLPPQLKAEAKAAADAEGIPLGEWIRDAMRGKLDWLRTEAEGEGNAK